MLKQGEDLVKQMGLEARGMDDAVLKRDLLSKVRDEMCVIVCIVRREHLLIP